MPERDPEQPIFPVAPAPATRTCIALDEGLITDQTGLPCVDCELYQQTGGCDVLESGRANQVFSGRVLEATQRRVAAMQDRVIPDFLTAGGIEALIETDPRIAREFVDSDWAVIVGDLRGLKDVNDSVSYDAGDNLLLAGGGRMHQVRDSPEKRTAPEEHRTNPDLQDIGFRERGSDELGKWVRNVSREQALAVLKRMVTRFSLEQARLDDERSILPILGTFAMAHVSEIRSQYVQEQPTTDEGYEALARNIFSGAVRIARAKQEKLKTSQYDAMWAAVCETLNTTGEPIPDKPADERVIATRFRAVCLPNFNTNFEATLRSAGPYMQ